MRIRHTVLPALASVAVIAAMASPAAAASSNRDSDRDGMPDRWEVVHKLNPKKAADAKKDADKDGVTNLQEYRLGGDPRVDDTDGDGVDDALEAKFRTKLNKSDSDGDGVKDGDEDANHDGICDRDQRAAAGVIEAFDETTGDLTMTTRSGATRTVTLTDDTEIEQREHKGWRHVPGGEVSDGIGHHHGDDADDDSSDDDADDSASDDSGSDSSVFGDDDWTESDADDSLDDSADDSGDSDEADVVDPENVELLADGVVVLKVKLASDGTVAELKLA